MDCRCDDIKVQFGVSLSKLFSLPFFSVGSTLVSIGSENSEELQKYATFLKGKKLVRTRRFGANLSRQPQFRSRTTRPFI
jgi:hypothetical protein